MNKILLSLIAVFYLNSIAYSQSPVNLSVSAINSNDALMNWDSGGCSSAYKLRYKENGNSTWQSAITISNTGASETYNLTGLTQSTTYNWRVKCVTGSGWSSIDTFSTPSSCVSAINQSSTGFSNNPVYGYGNNNQTIDLLSITNLSNCDLNIRPEFIISHQDSSIEQGDIKLQWQNIIFDPANPFWAIIPYEINGNGDAVGFWNYPIFADSTGILFGINDSTTLPIKIHFENANNNPNQNLAPLGN